MQQGQHDPDAVVIIKAEQWEQLITRVRAIEELLIPGYELSKLHLEQVKRQQEVQAEIARRAEESPGAMPPTEQHTKQFQDNPL